MTSQRGKHTTAIHILPNISRNNGNQTMGFGQLIEYYMRKIFLKNHTQIGVEKTLYSFNWPNVIGCLYLVRYWVICVL